MLLHLLDLLLRPSSPSPNGFGFADPPVALWRQSILNHPQRSILNLQYDPYTGVAQSNTLRWRCRDLHPSLARHTSTFNEFFKITYDPTHHELLCKSSKTLTVRYCLTMFLIRLGRILLNRL